MSWKQFLAEMGFGPEAVQSIAGMWNEPWRVYHTEANHLVPLFDALMRESLAGEARDSLLLAAVFHDVVYDPRERDNEEQACRVFDQMARENAKLHGCAVVDDVKRIIDNTKPSNYRGIAPGSLEDVFVRHDISHLTVDDPNAWLDQERLIQKEFQFVDWDDYRKGKSALLREIEASYPAVARAARFITHQINTTAPHIGLYAGTFAPFHLGHLNILKKAEKVFDKVIVLAGRNPEKDPIPGMRARLADILKYHQVVFHDGLLSEFIGGLNYPVTMIRGLRTDTDFKKEEINLRWMQSLSRQPVSMVFIPCDKELEHVSSSMIRMVCSFDEAAARKYIVDTDMVYATDQISGCSNLRAARIEGID
ncbi:MAG: adenylyltransferase/cytidyltransferase family protein [Candidatus Sumerlaeia bacterium]